MGLVALACVAVVIEAGWLALWPLCPSLSHSQTFTTAYLASYPAPRALLEALAQIARTVWPDLPDGAVASALGQPVLVAPALALTAILTGICVLYVVGVALAARSGAARIVLAGAVVFQVTLLFLPGLFSQDVFSYIAYGRTAVDYGLNPYVWPPSAIAKDPVLGWVADVWRTYACPYGPLWVDVQTGMALLTGGFSLVDQALAYRGLSNLLLLANLGLAWRLLGRVVALGGGHKTAAFAALAWNPLLLLEVAGDAHNDVLMITLSLLAMVVLTDSRAGRARVARREILAGVWLTCAALVKYLAGVGVAWVGVAAVARSGTGWRRIARVFLVGLLALLVIVAVSAPWLELPDSLDPILSETAGVGYVNAVPDMVALWLGDRLLAPDTAQNDARLAERVVTLSIFATYLVWQTRRVWGRPSPRTVLRASVLSMLLFILLVSTSVQAWYFGLPASLAILLGGRSRLAWVTVGYGLAALLVLNLSYYLRDLTPSGVWALYTVAPLLGLLGPARIQQWRLRGASSERRYVEVRQQIGGVRIDGQRSA